MPLSFQPIQLDWPCFSVQQIKFFLAEAMCKQEIAFGNKHTMSSSLYTRVVVQRDTTSLYQDFDFNQDMQSDLVATDHVPLVVLYLCMVRNVRSVACPINSFASHHLHPASLYTQRRIHFPYTPYPRNSHRPPIQKNSHHHCADHMLKDE